MVLVMRYHSNEIIHSTPKTFANAQHCRKDQLRKKTQLGSFTFFLFEGNEFDELVQKYCVRYRAGSGRA